MPVTVMRCPVCFGDLRILPAATWVDPPVKHPNLGEINGPCWSIPAICPKRHSVLVRMAVMDIPANPPNVPKAQTKTLVWVDHRVTPEEYKAVLGQVKKTDAPVQTSPANLLNSSLTQEQSVGSDLKKVLDDLKAQGKANLKLFTSPEELAAYLKEKVDTDFPEPDLGPDLDMNPPPPSPGSCGKCGTKPPTPPTPKTSDQECVYYMPMMTYEDIDRPPNICLDYLLCPDCGAVVGSPSEMFYVATAALSPLVNDIVWIKARQATEDQALEQIIKSIRAIKCPIFGEMNTDEDVQRFQCWIETTANEVVERSRLLVLELVSKLLQEIAAFSKNKHTATTKEMVYYFTPTLVYNFKQTVIELLVMLFGDNPHGNDNTIDGHDGEDDDDGEQWKKE
jgi:hypothetical protein